MILFVSGATATVRKWTDVGELIVPNAHNAPETLKLVPGRWAMDNGAYTGFDATAFVRMLERFYGRPGCRFVTCPDAVGDAHATLQQWPFWSRLIRGIGFVPALVLQDGMMVDDVPWREVGAVFIGGHTEWKLGGHARELVAYAKARGIWVHAGRVNSRRRIFAMQKIGVDSWDGTSYSMFPDAHIPNGVQDAADAVAQGELPL